MKDNFDQSLEDESDVDLVARCQQGDMDAFNDLVTRYRGKVYAIIYNMVRNDQDAWDLAQDSFVKAWKSLPKFKGTASFYTWLYRIATNVTIDWLRKQKKYAAVEFDESLDQSMSGDPSQATPHLPSPRKRLEQVEIGAQIRSALAKLTPEHRVVMVMKEIDGLQYNEIAEVLGCSIGTVMSRIFYARKNLQKLLGATYEQL